MQEGLYIFDTEADGLLPTMTHFHVALFKQWHKDHFVMFLDPDAEGYQDALAFAKNKDVDNLEIRELKDIKLWVKTEPTITGIACHNMFGFDLPAFDKFSGIKTTIIPEETVAGRNIRLLDTLSMSRCLYPDRQLPKGCPSKVKMENGTVRTVGPHGLEAWGWRCGNHKIEIEDWQGLPLWKYVDRVWEDVIINELAYDKLIEEAKDDAKGIGIDWRAALKANMYTDFLMYQQERVGSIFNVKKAQDLLEYIDAEMQRIADIVEPQLPVKDKPKSRCVTFIPNPFKGDGSISTNGWKFAKNILGFEVDLDALYITRPPKRSFKGSGELSKTAVKWCIDNGCSDEKDMPDFIRKKMLKYENTKPVPDEMLPEVKKALRSGVLPEGVNKEPMLLSNQADIKEWLFSKAGWKPTEWTAKDVTKDDRKQKISEVEQQIAVKAWLYKIKDSVYRKAIEEFTEYKILNLLHDSRTFKYFVRSWARRLPNSPKLKDEQGNLCPNLSRLNSDLGNQIVRWLSLRNRRSVIKCLDPKKNTGWLNNPRLLVDGRLPTSFSGITNTNRRKHKCCANVPKPKPSVLLGYEMRDLWTVPEGYLQLGCDASNLENMVAAWWAWVYGNDNGEYYHLINHGDPHESNAREYSRVAGIYISRDDGKRITYGILYGCGAKKAGDMLGVSSDKGQQAIDAFWNNNLGLKAVKEYLEEQWKKSGKKYIRGIDGRKIYTRSVSSLLNAALQSTGAILMDKAGINYEVKSVEHSLVDKGIRRIIYYHDEYQLEVPRGSIRMKPFSTGLGIDLPHDILATVKKISNEEDAPKALADKYEYSLQQAKEILSTYTECKEYMDGFKESKFTLAGKPYVEGDTLYAAYCPAGEYLIQSIEESAKSLGSPITITGEYLIGRSWAGAH